MFLFYFGNIWPHLTLFACCCYCRLYLFLTILKSFLMSHENLKFSWKKAWVKMWMNVKHWPHPVLESWKCWRGKWLGLKISLYYRIFIAFASSCVKFINECGKNKKRDERENCALSLIIQKKKKKKNIVDEKVLIKWQKKQHILYVSILKLPIFWRLSRRQKSSNSKLDKQASKCILKMILNMSNVYMHKKYNTK